MKKRNKERIISKLFVYLLSIKENEMRIIVSLMIGVLLEKEMILVQMYMLRKVMLLLEKFSPNQIKMVMRKYSIVVIQLNLARKDLLIELLKLSHQTDIR
jgi:hypothetical protein